VALGGPPESPDPPQAYAGWAVTSLTHDGLVAVRRAAGADGAQLVPDLATDLPVPTDGGRTWTFRLRAGIAWSTGGTVRPRDVRASFERLIRDGVPYFSALRGAGSCTPAACDLSTGITLDEVDGTVSFHLVRPDADFLARLALPQASVLPAGSPPPVRPEQAPGFDWSRLGGTGPYRVSAVEPGGTVLLVRNERFEEWSRDAAPGGRADRIEVQYDVDPSAATDQVLAGRLDAALDPPPERLPELTRRFPAQVIRVDEAATYRLVLNVRRPPFSNLDARRAVAAAVDRRAVAGDLGGGLLGTPSCQVLPPVVVGHAPYCPFGERPDLQRARQLVQRSGTAGQVVRLYAHPPRAQMARRLERTLDAIGYDARLTVVQDDYFRLVADTRTTPEAHVSGWYAETPSATSFALLARCASFVEQADNNTNLNVSGYCDRRAEQLIERALRTQQEDPSGAASAWHDVDRHLTDTVAWVPLASLQRAVLLRDASAGLVFIPIIGPALELLPAGERSG
jgi:peptide/nickel transport system substrate-binding protein